MDFAISGYLLDSSSCSVSSPLDPSLKRQPGKGQPGSSSAGIWESLTGQIGPVQYPDFFFFTTVVLRTNFHCEATSIYALSDKTISVVPLLGPRPVLIGRLAFSCVKASGKLIPSIGGTKSDALSSH